MIRSFNIFQSLYIPTELLKSYWKVQIINDEFPVADNIGGDFHKRLQATLCTFANKLVKVHNKRKNKQRRWYEKRAKRWTPQENCNRWPRTILHLMKKRLLMSSELHKTAQERRNRSELCSKEIGLRALPHKTPPLSQNGVILYPFSRRKALRGKDSGW